MIIQPNKHKTTVLFILFEQLGYLTDVRKYIEYLKDEFDITVISRDCGLSRYKFEGVNVKYITSDSSFRYRLDLYREVKKELQDNDIQFVFVNYFRGVSLLSPLLRNKACLLDFRTIDVNKSCFKRMLFNAAMYLESISFNKKSAIAERIKEQLHLPKETFILPLGTDICLMNKRSDINKIRLIYVGTFSNRRIEDTIEGLRYFLDIHNCPIHYAIIGNGTDSEIELLKEKINDLRLQKYVSLVGYVKHHELENYMLQSHIGISYIPITQVFNFQPPTKTFEYMGFGLPVLATDTYANRQIVNQNNGILIKDNAESFAKGLIQMISTLDKYDEAEIKGSVRRHTWKAISESLKKYIECSLAR